ncbi:hypothetical protein [Streptomyces decoyicus]
MAKLPDNMELRERFNLGETDTMVAEEFGASRQAVQKRWAAMGLYRAPFVQQVKELLDQGWDLVEGDQHSWISKSLRLVLRRRLGDVLKVRQQEQATKFLATLRNEGLVVSYEQGIGWVYRPRTPEDKGLIVRWPTDRPLPDNRSLRALAMPSEGEELKPVAM